ncbi:MAG TPA: Na+/H+ antiporter NhaA [Trebonia sp.]|jgi:Na+/H+ antiporter NhaA
MTAPQPSETLWRHAVRTPLRQFLHTETGSAAVLALATIAALAWANASFAGYEHFWAIPVRAGIDGRTLSLDLRTFVDSGLMAFFFLVVGLEARREWDMGELRIRSRVTLPLLAGLAGMAVPVVLFLVITAAAGAGARHGWGVAMSTDTAFALGLLVLAGRALPDRVRTYLVTVMVVDDLAGLLVIAIAYSGHVKVVPLIVAIALLIVTWVLKQRGIRSGPLYLVIGVAAWIACYESGVDPIVIGLVNGLMTCARPPVREDLEQASTVFRAFREQPTAEFAQEAREVVRTAISANDRLQSVFLPASSYVFVPLFALANAGISLNGSFLAHAYTSPITLGVIIGYVAGKPIGTTGAAALITRLTKGRLRPPVGWGSVAGAGVAAGTPFTVSFLIAALAFADNPAELAQAKLGVLSALVCSAILTWGVFKTIARLPVRARLRALFGTEAGITDLVVAVDPATDHIRGPKKGALVTLVEYGDFECPYCGQAESALRELIKEHGELRFVFRHLPLTDVHPHAQMAAEAAEAAASQGKFWEMHDALMDHQGALTFRDLTEYAKAIGLDTGTFEKELRAHDGTVARVAEDVESADLDSVSGTPSFFINGRRHHGAYDLETLKQAVRAAKSIAIIAQ